MNYRDTKRKILSNLSGDRIREIRIIPDKKVGSYNTYWLKACLKTNIITVLLYEEEKDSFIRKLSEHGWYALYRGAYKDNSERYLERYFHVTNIEEVSLINSNILEVSYQKTIVDCVPIFFDDPINEIQQTIDSLKEAGRFDLLLKIS